MDYTPFAGLERLLAGEPLDGRFLFWNPTIIDALLKVGAVTHRHDAHARLVDPVTAPTITPANTGGTIPSDTAVYVGYTFIDADGGETLLSDVAQVSTDPGLPDPTAAPDLASDNTAGTLLADTYYYAVTVIDGLGGETMIGPSSEITIDPGFPNARITVSGLAAIMADVGGTGWRLWRAVGAGAWHMLATGVGASVVDDGSFHGDCDVTPPTTPQTNQTNKVTVQVPGPAPTGAVSFNLYLSDNGSFTDPALVANHLVADLGTDIILTSLATITGAPPPVSLTLPGAAKIDPDTDMVGFPWKRPVANLAALPAVGNTDGDIRETLDDHALHIWTGAAWAALIAGGGGPVAPLYDLETVVGWKDVYGATVVKLRGHRRTDNTQVASEQFDGAAGAIGDGYGRDGAGLGIPMASGNNTSAIHYPAMTGPFLDGFVERQVTITSLNFTRIGVTIGHGRKGLFAWITNDGFLRLYWRDVDNDLAPDWHLISADALPAAPAITDTYNIQLEKVRNHLHATVFQGKAVVAECEGDIPVAMQAEYGDLAAGIGVGLVDKWSNPDAWTTDWLNGWWYQYHYELWADTLPPAGGLISRRLLSDEGERVVQLNALVPTAFAADWGDGDVVAQYRRDYDGYITLNGKLMKSGGLAPATLDVIASLDPWGAPQEVQLIPVATGDDDGAELGMLRIGIDGLIVWIAGRSTTPAVKHPFVSLDGISYRGT